MGRDYKSVRSQYYLRRWKMLETNRSILSLREVENAKLLFNSLPKLPKESLDILKAKYYDTPNLGNFDHKRGVYTSNIPISDKAMAFKLNMEPADYSKERRLAEIELEKIMIEVGQLILKREEMIYLKINQFLYVKEVDIVPSIYDSTWITIDDVTLSIGMTSDKKKVFDMRDETTRLGVEKLERYGFLREALNQYELEEWQMRY
ncbi:hypothetical protein DOK76_03765 [Vagococcus sp. DIV0080]|uniref:Uncharacterized protein n=1 Tax=Candidatus Vagococcus giribetii TaxID=2230876 RepID=A0ABS3HQY1_9ENTE|nr:hypothetical protein [Vagococcus sp. DIV0080]MBO0476173.1 hypothetical protein [Vagococcus sp. DIV0080]